MASSTFKKYVLVLVLTFVPGLYAQSLQQMRMTPAEIAAGSTTLDNNRSEVRSLRVSTPKFYSAIPRKRVTTRFSCSCPRIQRSKRTHIAIIASPPSYPASGTSATATISTPSC
jgi:hypothetical protein